MKTHFRKRLEARRAVIGELDRQKDHASDRQLVTQSDRKIGLVNLENRLKDHQNFIDAMLDIEDQ